VELKPSSLRNRPKWFYVVVVLGDGACCRILQEVSQREQEGQLDEGFLAEVSAQLQQAKEDKDKPGLEAMLQKVLQLYASKVLSKRSYATKGNEVLKAEQCLEEIIKDELCSFRELSTQSERRGSNSSM
ncbi:hypothetical protein M8C21_022646, partial [Ambrosia artemisiifolia]